MPTIAASDIFITNLTYYVKYRCNLIVPLTLMKAQITTRTIKAAAHPQTIATITLPLVSFPSLFPPVSATSHQAKTELGRAHTSHKGRSTRSTVSGIILILHGTTCGSSPLIPCPKRIKPVETRNITSNKVCR